MLCKTDQSYKTHFTSLICFPFKEEEPQFIKLRPGKLEQNFERVDF